MKKRFSLIVGMVLFFLFSFVPLFQGGVPSAMAKEVQIGFYADLTGPIAVAAGNVFNGFMVYVKWANELAPVPGVNIKVIWEDTSYSAPKYVTAFKKFKAKNVSLACNLSSTASATVSKLHAKAKIPVLSPGGYKPALVPPSYEFGTHPPYVNYFAAAAIQFMKEWKEKGMKRKPRIMFITWDNAYGRGHIPEGTPWAEKIGYEMLPPQFFTSGRPTDMSVQLTRAKEMGADLVHMNSLAGHFAVLLKDAYKMGLHGKIQFCVGSGDGISELIRLAGSESAEGAWVVKPNGSWPNDSKGYKWIIDEFKRQKQPLKSHDSSLGFAFGRTAVEAIRAAAKKVGPGNVDNNAVYDALCNLKDLDMWGLQPNVSYAADLRIPYNRFYVIEVKDHKWQDKAYVEVPWFVKR